MDSFFWINNFIFLIICTQISSIYGPEGSHTLGFLVFCFGGAWKWLICNLLGGGWGVIDARRLVAAKLIVVDFLNQLSALVATRGTLLVQIVTQRVAVLLWKGGGVAHRVEGMRTLHGLQSQYFGVLGYTRWKCGVIVRVLLVVGILDKTANLLTIPVASNSTYFDSICPYFGKYWGGVCVCELLVEGGCYLEGGGNVVGGRGRVRWRLLCDCVINRIVFEQLVQSWRTAPSKYKSALTPLDLPPEPPLFTQPGIAPPTLTRPLRTPLKTQPGAAKAVSARDLRDLGRMAGYCLVWIFRVNCVVLCGFGKEWS